MFESFNLFSSHVKFSLFPPSLLWILSHAAGAHQQIIFLSNLYQFQSKTDTSLSFKIKGKKFQSETLTSKSDKSHHIWNYLKNKDKDIISKSPIKIGKISHKKGNFPPKKPLFLGNNKLEYTPMWIQTIIYLNFSLPPVINN